MTHLKITQAGLTALATTIIGQLVAFVPAFSSDKQLLISAASTVIAAAFLIANSVHALIASHASLADIETGVRNLVQDELGKVDFNGLVRQGLAGVNVGGVVQGELTKILSAGLAGSVSSTVPVRTVATIVPGGGQVVPAPETPPPAA